MLSLMEQNLQFVLAHKTARDMKQLLGTGEAIKMCKRCGVKSNKKRCAGKAQEHLWIFVATDLFRPTHTSSVSLTAHDAQANVGITSNSIPPRAHRRAVRNANRRVRKWRSVGCTRSPLPTSDFFQAAKVPESKIPKNVIF